MFPKFKKSVLNTIFPIKCLHCHYPGKIICDNCLSTIKLLPLQVCPYCEKAITLNGEVCGPCRRQFQPALTRLLVTADYKNKLLARAIHLFKYKFIQDLANPLGSLLNKKINKSDIPTPDYIIPIPLHPRRLRWRGFNQAELLAINLSKNLLPGLTIPILGDKRHPLIIRRHYTKPQKDIKNYQQRQANLKNIFQINPTFLWKEYGLNKKNLINKNILIVDDISTTGSTIFNYAQELKKLNPKSISAIVLGRQH